MKHKMKLTKEEKELRDSIERGEWKSRQQSETQKTVSAAQDFLESQRKEAKVNLRLNQADVSRIREKARRVGLPYQTLIASLIHQYATDQLVPKEPLEDSIRKVVKEELKNKAF